MIIICQAYITELTAVLIFSCLVLQTTKRNDEKDYISAKSCGIWTLIWSISAIVWGGLWGIGFIAFVAGVAS